jgi:carbonic anhydrase/acetyltransferase-like protein (isoleucine patch superfamily)
MQDFAINTTPVTPDDTVFIASTAAVIGDVRLGRDASVWYGASVRADLAPIIIGEASNVQDNASLHVDFDLPVVIGARVTIGHNAVVHGATVEDECLIGMGAVVMNRAVVGKGSLIAAGAVVTEGIVIPPGSLAAGVPAKVIRQLSPEQQAGIRENAAIYIACGRAFRESNR